MRNKPARHGRVLLVAALILGLGLALIPAGSASAAPPGGPIACVAQGTVVTTPGTPPGWDWSIQGDGTCIGDFRGPYKLSFTGQGTSSMLGLCDNLVVTDLNIDVTMTLVSRLNNQVRTFAEKWFSPVTTFPIATPFFISDSTGSLVGAGAIETRIRVNCPPAGAPTAVFNWVQTKS